MSKKVAQCLDSWRPISDRIIEARFFSRFIKTTVIQVYAPTNEADDEVKVRTVTKDRGRGAEARYALGHRRLECKSG